MPEVNDGRGLGGGGCRAGQGAVRLVQQLAGLGQIHGAPVDEEELPVACRQYRVGGPCSADV